jgi:hypothetical protein
MTAQYPEIEVVQKSRPTKGRSGLLNNIAIIGAFDTTVADPQVFASLDEAQTALGTDETYNGCKVLPIIFTSGTCLAVNVTTESEGTRDKTLTTAKLSAALAKIKGEDFDMIFVADNLADDAIVILDTFCQAIHKMKMPAGYVAAITRANIAAYTTTAGIAGEFCYGLISQSMTVNGTEYDVLESAAYYAKVIAELNPGNSMTMKQVPGVTAISPEYTFETGDQGRAMVGLGLTVLKALDRGNSKYVVVNSEQPNGLDLYINRVRDYVIKEMALHQFLGNRNRTPTYNQIIQELDRVEYKCVNTMDLLQDIEYNVEKKDASTVDVNITKLVYDGIITKINVYYSIEVQ